MTVREPPSCPQEEVWAHLDEEAASRCAPLLALLPGAAGGAGAAGVPLAHNVAALLRRLLQKVTSTYIMLKMFIE